MQDTGHVLVDNLGCGSAYREGLERQMKSGERSFRDISEDMWGSLTIPVEDGFDVMRENMDLDPAFKEFHEFCKANGIPFNVISSGLRPILRKVLDAFLGAQEVCPYSLLISTLRERKRKRETDIERSHRKFQSSPTMPPSLMENHGNLSGSTKQNWATTKPSQLTKAVLRPLKPAAMAKSHSSSSSVMVCRILQQPERQMFSSAVKD